MNKDTNFSLNHVENYKKDFECNLSEIVNKYAQLIIEYIKFIQENIKIKNENFAKFIIVRGLETITHVFQYILYITKNIDLTYYHCQKSFYFYVEFVGQITEEDKMFLQLTTRDATMYVYKKTIFDINNELKKLNENNSIEFKEKVDIISSYIKIYETYLLKILQKNNNVSSHIQDLINITTFLTNFTKKIKISKIENITEKLYYKIENVDKFFEINHLLVKYFLKNTGSIEKLTCKNMNSEVFDEKILESSENFVEWLLTS